MRSRLPWRRVQRSNSRVLAAKSRTRCSMTSGPISRIRSSEASMAYSSAKGSRAALVLLGARQQFGNAVVKVVDVAPIAMAAPAHHIGLKPIAQLRSNVEKSGAVRARAATCIHAPPACPVESWRHRSATRPRSGFHRYTAARRARARNSAQLRERRREAGVVVHRADDRKARLGVHGFVETLPGTSGGFNAETFQQPGRVKIVREFVLQSEHVVAGVPVEPREQQSQRRGCIRNERDVVRRAVESVGRSSRGCGRHRHTRRENPRRPVHRDERSAGLRRRWRAAAIGPNVAVLR